MHQPFLKFVLVFPLEKSLALMTKLVLIFNELFSAQFAFHDVSPAD